MPDNNTILLKKLHSNFKHSREKQEAQRKTYYQKENKTGQPVIRKTYYATQKR